MKIPFKWAKGKSLTCCGDKFHYRNNHYIIIIINNHFLLTWFSYPGIKAILLLLQALNLLIFPLDFFFPL